MQLYSDFKWMIYCKARAGQTIQSDGAKEEEHVRRWLNVVGKYTKWILYFPSLHYLTSQWPPAWSSNVHTIYLLRWKKQTTSTGYCLNMSHSLNDDATRPTCSSPYCILLRCFLRLSLYRTACPSCFDNRPACSVCILLCMSHPHQDGHFTTICS